MRETAYAKINLALHVRARRHDGYHEIETLFAFVDAGDELAARRSEHDELTVTGEFASQLPNPFGNILAKTLTSLPHAEGLAITLEKNLPVAAGLGGGSADAGAMFRLMREAYGLPDDWRERAVRLGADVPACVESVACVGRGIGTEIEPVENDWAGRPVLLVNPRIPLSTVAVFAAWGGEDRGPLPDGPVSRIAAEGRNDLDQAAISLCPPVAQVLEALQQTGADLVRMSGSGATCFALYRQRDVRREAAERLASAHPDWWQIQGNLR